MRRLTPPLILALALAACGPSYRDVYPRTPPSSAYSAYLRHQLALRDGDLEDALEHLHDALRYDPDSPALRNAHADLLARLGHDDLALRKLDALIDDHPDWPPPHITHARILHARGQHADAARVLDALLPRHPDDRDATWLRARVAVAMLQPAVARDALHTLTTHHPYHRPAWRMLADLALAADDAHAASAHLQRLLSLTDTPDEALFLELADALFASEQDGRALDVLQRCADAGAQNQRCQARLTQRALDAWSGEPDALRDLVAAIASNTALLVETARDLREHRPELAAAFIHHTLELRPELSDLALDLGEAHLTLHQHEEAAQAFARVDARSPFKALAERRLGHTLLLMGQRDDAIDALERARALSPNDPDTLTLLGDAYRAAGLDEDATGLYQLALKHTHDEALRDALIHKLDRLNPTP